MNMEPIQTGPLRVNTFIVPIAGSAVFIVDPAGCELTGDENVISDYIEEHGYVPIAIVLTHGHFDHITGLKSLREAFPNICIAIHSKDKDCIGANSALMQEKFLDGFGDDRLLEYVENLPAADILLEDGENLENAISMEMIVSAYSGSVQAPDIEAIQHELAKWKVIHTPGHTAGSICLYNDVEKVLISGDTVFYNSYGRTDLYGGSETEIQHSLRKLMETLPGETVVYPGHEHYGFALGENF